MSIIFTVLFIANLFATGYSCIVVATIYDTDLYSDDAIPALYAGVYGLTLLLALKLTEYNINLALLLPVVAIIANILIVKLAVKINYKHNVRTYQRIKF
jgi:hypothetical protein